MQPRTAEVGLLVTDETNPGGSPTTTPDETSLRDALDTDRTRTTERIAALQRDVDLLVEASTSVAVDDEHDPEGSTIAFERSQALTLLEQAEQHLGDLDGALERLGHGTFGVCTGCGGRIADARLEARPTATTCIDCASHRR